MKVITLCATENQLLSMFDKSLSDSEMNICIVSNKGIEQYLPAELAEGIDVFIEESLSSAIKTCSKHYLAGVATYLIGYEVDPSKLVQFSYLQDNNDSKIEMILLSNKTPSEFVESLWDIGPDNAIRLVSKLDAILSIGEAERKLVLDHDNTVKIISAFNLD